jgi:RHS repeat-associated protein
VAATDASGTLLWRESYAPYGKRLTREAGSKDTVWYTGKPEDVGLIYFGARWYDPAIGRFMAMDPAGFDPENIHSFGRYAYANDNPYKFHDPDGNSPLDIGFFIADSIKFAIAVNSGNPAAIQSAAADLAGSAIGLLSPVPGTGQLIKGARAGRKLAKVVKEIPISRARYGGAADHIADAQKAGHSDVLTIARDAASPNRQASIGGLPKVPGKQLDEYPPAMFKEGGAGASVRAISPKDNMAAGACIGNACRGLSNGDKVRIKVVD